MEEQSILRRLEATLFTLRNWSVTKSKAAVNNWLVRDFVLITQGDLLNTQDCYTLLQVSQFADPNLYLPPPLLCVSISP